MGVEYLRIEGSIIIRYVHLIRNKQQLDSIRSGTVESWEELRDEVGNKFPLSLSINGDKVQSKVISGTVDRESLLNTVLPNADSSALTYSAWHNEKHTVCSIARSEQIALILNECRSIGFRVVCLHIAPIPMVAVAAHIGLDNDFVSNGWMVHIGNGVIQRSSAEDNVRVKGMRLHPSYHLAFSSGWSHLVPDPHCWMSHPELLHSFLEEEKYRRRYQKTLVLTAFTLLILLGFHLGFSSLLDGIEASSNQELQSWNELNNDVVSLRQEHSELTKIAELSGTRSSIVDELWVIAQSVPETITLDEMDVFPVNRIEQERDIIRKDGVISIIGSCESSAHVSSWIKDLQSTNRFRNVILIYYNSTGISPEFNVEIEI